MNEKEHLDAHRARALAEGDDGASADAAHARTCATCARRVEQAKAEEATLRAALPIDPPRDLLAQTLASVRESGREESGGGRPATRRRPAKAGSQVPPLAIALGVTLAVVVGAFVVGRRPSPATPDATPVVRPPTPPPVVSPVPIAPPHVAPEPDAPEPDEDQDSQDPWSAPIPDEPEPAVEPEDAPEVVVEAPTSPTPAPTTTETETAETTTSEVAKAFARVRSGSLTTGGRALAAGSAVLAGVALRAGSTAVELEVEDGVLLALAPRTGLTLDEESPGGAVLVRLERGRLFARTAGARPWAVLTPEGRAAPLGTALLAQREGARTRVATLEGLVRLSPPGTPDDDDAALDLRPGFEAELTRGRAPVARPLAAARALTWLPEALRPTPPATPVLVAVHDFEDGRGRWTKGDARAGGARGSRGSLRGVAGASDYAASVELEAPAGVVTLDPDLWLEATVRVDRRTRVALQLWDFDRKENLAHITTVEPGRWTTLAAPLRAWTDAAGAPRTTPVARGGRATCLTVFAGEEGETLELVVDDVRLWRQP